MAFDLGIKYMFDMEKCEELELQFISFIGLSALNTETIVGEENVILDPLRVPKNESDNNRCQEKSKQNLLNIYFTRTWEPSK